MQCFSSFKPSTPDSPVVARQFNCYLHLQGISSSCCPSWLVAACIVRAHLDMHCIPAAVQQPCLLDSQLGHHAMQGIPHLRNPTQQNYISMAIRSGPTYVLLHGVPEHCRHIVEDLARTMHDCEYVRLYKPCETYLAIFVFPNTNGNLRACSANLRFLLATFFPLVFGNLVTILPLLGFWIVSSRICM